jgi:hypothetical protein
MCDTASGEKHEFCTWINDETVLSLKMVAASQILVEAQVNEGNELLEVKKTDASTLARLIRPADTHC